MIETSMATGDVGHLYIDDKTDSTDKTVDLYIQAYSPVFIPNMPWTYSIDGVMSPWKAYTMKFSTLKQKLGTVYVGYADAFTLHLGNTGHSQLGGPTDFPITLNQLGVKTVTIKVGDSFKDALPFVRVDGVWTPVQAWVMHQGEWKQAT